MAEIKKATEMVATGVEKFFKGVAMLIHSIVEMFAEATISIDGLWTVEDVEAFIRKQIDDHNDHIVVDDTMSIIVSLEPLHHCVRFEILQLIDEKRESYYIDYWLVPDMITIKAPDEDGTEQSIPINSVRGSSSWILLFIAYLFKIDENKIHIDFKEEDK